MKQIITIPIITTIVVIASCDKRCEQNGYTEHWYDLPVSITPAKDTFYLGDTIWIENSFNDVLVNKNYNKTYTLTNFDFKSNIGITDLNSPPLAISYKDPQIFTIDGTTRGTNVGSVDYQVMYIDYAYTNNRYRYKAAFVVDKPGFYLFKFFSYRGASNLDDVDITSCPNENIKITYNANDKADNNYSMIKNAVDTYYAKWTRKEFDEAGGYCFYVK